MNEIETRPPITSTRIGQGTAVEQSRAAAEVQAAVVVAQQVPRNLHSAQTAMRESCTQMGLAERASYRYPRGGETVSGASVYLARELARCWGNVQYGLSELRRDDEYGQSEMQAWAWDVQTNTRVVSTFIVPHMRDKKGGAVKLVELRDIYENNTNQASRRLREAIFNILPPWFVDEARTLCARTLEQGGGVPLARRVTDAVSTFELYGVTVAQLEAKVGRPTGQWTAHDVAQLVVIGKSIHRGEVTVADEFPPERVTADEILARRTVTEPDPAAATAETLPPPPMGTDETAEKAPDTPDEGADSAVPDEGSSPGPIRTVQKRMLQARFKDLGMAGDAPDELERRLNIVIALGNLHRAITSVDDLTSDEAATVLVALSQVKNREGLFKLIEVIAATEQP